MDTGEHKFDGEVSLWRQVIEDVTALANTEKKGIAQINSAAKKMLKASNMIWRQYAQNVSTNKLINSYDLK